MVRLSIVALVSGAVFGLGLVLSGMTQPTKVIGFLDVTGSWDPTLAWVMGGAVTVSFIANLWARRRDEPFLAPRFLWPTRRDLDGKLFLGAAVFGVGWGLGGFCPGPGLVSLGAAGLDAVVFVGTMVGAMAVTAGLERRAASR